jgi:hypothetical protein
MVVKETPIPVTTRIVESLEDILALASEGIGEPPKEKNPDSTRENWGTGMIRFVNVGLNLTARTDTRQEATLTPTNMRKYAQFWAMQQGSAEIKNRIINALIDSKMLKATLDTVWTENEQAIRTFCKID